MNKQLLAAAAALCLCSTGAFAQGMKPQRIENVTWVSVVHVKFKPGKRERAMDIIEKYFAAADKAAGTGAGVRGYHFATGGWDAVYFFPMSGGPADLTWATSPDDVKWMGEMAKLAGDADKAKAILDEFDTLIERQQRDVAHMHPNW